MCRRYSPIFSKTHPKPFTRTGPPSTKNGVSYCYAIVKPDEKAATRYEEKMSESSLPDRLETRKLSDQDLLEEYLGDDFLLMSHEFMAFPSWWSHTNVCYKVFLELRKVYGDWKCESYYELGRRMAEQVGAVHLSKGFDAPDLAAQQERAKRWKASLIQGQTEYNKKQPADIGRAQWAEDWFRDSDVNNMLDAMKGMQDEVLCQHLQQKAQVIDQVQQTSQGHPLCEGLAKTSLIVSLTREELEIYTKLEQARRSLKPPM